ncbi:helix-turn-helix transcriptional regulator (plasmid) [Providencia rettgeri]|nr:helix-turn-helix transcriptional regulator [Providencia rettgeri]
MKLNKSDQQLFRYEKGVNKIDLDNIINYLEVLQVDINHFFSELN